MDLFITSFLFGKRIQTHIKNRTDVKMSSVCSRLRCQFTFWITVAKRSRKRLLPVACLLPDSHKMFECEHYPPHWITQPYCCQSSRSDATGQSVNSVRDRVRSCISSTQETESETIDDFSDRRPQCTCTKRQHLMPLENFVGASSRTVTPVILDRSRLNDSSMAGLTETGAGICDIPEVELETPRAVIAPDSDAKVSNPAKKSDPNDRSPQIPRSFQTENNGKFRRKLLRNQTISNSFVKEKNILKQRVTSNIAEKSTRIMPQETGNSLTLKSLGKKIKEIAVQTENVIPVPLFHVSSPVEPIKSAEHERLIPVERTLGEKSQTGVCPSDIVALRRQQKSLPLRPSNLKPSSPYRPKSTDPLFKSCNEPSAPVNSDLKLEPDLIQLYVLADKNDVKSTYLDQLQTSLTLPTEGPPCWRRIARRCMSVDQILPKNKRPQCQPNASVVSVGICQAY